MQSTPEETLVLDELLKVQDQYTEYERLAQLAFIASRAFVTDGPRIDTERHPAGLVVKTSF